MRGPASEPRTNGAAYPDEAFKRATEVDHLHDFVTGYADNIPGTHGAPTETAAAE